jgi:hypothetical protein
MKREITSRRNGATRRGSRSTTVMVNRPFQMAGSSDLIAWPRARHFQTDRSELSGRDLSESKSTTLRRSRSLSEAPGIT